MTVPRSNNSERFEILASSLGGAFFVIYGAGLVAGTQLLTSEMLLSLGIAGLILLILLLMVGASRWVTVGTLLFTAKVMVAQVYWPDAAWFGVPLLAVISGYLAVAVLSRHWRSAGSFLLLSGAISGALLAGFIGDRFVPVTNGLILSGVVIEFVSGRIRIRFGEEARTIYGRMMFTVVVPCGAVFLGGMSGLHWAWNGFIVMAYLGILIQPLKRALMLAMDPFHRELVARLTRYASELPPGCRVLDAGSGEGQYAGLFEHCDRIGMDLAVGDSAWDYSGLDVVADLHALPVRDASMDSVVCTVTLEHLHSPWIAMEEMGRVLRPGGTGFFVVPFMWELHQEPHDYFRYSPHGFRHLAERAGLSVRECVAMGGYFRVMHYRLASLLKHAVRHPLLLLCLVPFMPLIACYLLISGAVDRVWKLCDHTLGYTIILTKRGEP